MRTKIIFFFMFGIICLYTSCIQSFTPEVEKYEELLVVDGGITDAPGPYTIKLSKSTRTQELSKFIPYPGCKVVVEDDIGNEVIFYEHARGIYQTDSSAMKGIPGRKYKLHISTPDGEDYESVEETLLKPIAIQSVYAELQHKSHPDLLYGRDGYQFYLDAETPPTANNFLLWSLQCTYKFRTDFQIDAYYANGRRNQVDNPDTLRTCYRTLDIVDIFILNTNMQNTQDIKHVALNYEDNYTKALSIRYSLKVQQYAINEAAFNYWNTIKKLRDMQGDLYTQQPYQAKNNLTNLKHPEKQALGFFTVAGYTEKRIFVNPPGIADHYDICTITGEPIKHLDDKLKLRPDLWPFFLVDPAQYKGDFWVDQDCMDCRRTGTLKKPDFWID